MVSRNKVVWLPRGWLPTYVGFCPSEKAWKREMKRLVTDKAARKQEVYPTSDASCSVFEKKVGPGATKTLCLITVAESLDEGWGTDAGRESIYGLLLHEAVHVWQFILKDIGEKVPSPEFEAYSVQALFIHLSSAYRRTRQKRAE